MSAHDRKHTAKHVPGKRSAQIGKKRLGRLAPSTNSGANRIQLRLSFATAALTPQAVGCVHAASYFVTVNTSKRAPTEKPRSFAGRNI